VVTLPALGLLVAEILPDQKELMIMWLFPFWKQPLPPLSVKGKLQALSDFDLSKTKK